MVTEFMSLVMNWIEEFFSAISLTITETVGLIYDAEGFTIIGTLMLFGLAVGLVYFGINFVVRLVKK